MSKNRGQSNTRSMMRRSKLSRVFNNKPDRKNNPNTKIRNLYLKSLK